VVNAEKPQAFWYVAYRGVGADEAARNVTVIDARPTSLIVARHGFVFTTGTV
jgi:hypothetical protein